MPAAIIIGSDKPSASSKSRELDIPADAVAVDGTTPAEGDEVEFTVKGTVKRTKGKNVSVEVTEANGQPLDQGAEKAEGDSDDDMMDLAADADLAQEE